MTPEPRFAVILCTHNGGEFIDEQLESLRAQACAPHYIALHDWSSEDNTSAKLRRWVAATSSPELASLHEHDTAPGACASFLAALKLAVEELPDATHFLFCDQDDLWARQKLAVYRETLLADSGRFDLLFSDVRLVSAQGRLLSDSFYRRRWSPYQARVQLDSPDIALVNPAIGMTMCISRRLAATLLAHAQAPWAMHDWAAAILCTIYGWRSKFVPQPLVDYRQHPASLRGAPAFSDLVVKLKRMRRRFEDLKTLRDCASTLPEAEAVRARALLPRNRFAAIGMVAASRNVRAWYQVFLALTLLVLW